MLTIERSLNVYAAGIPQIINLSQYDDDFQLMFSLYTSEGVFTVPSGTTAEIMGTKVDGNGYSADATISGNTVTVTGNNQMTACAGRNIFEIVLTKSGKRLATINFILQVERAALDADTIQSETVLKELQAIIDSAAASTQAAQDAEDAADRAEEAARTLTIDTTLTQSGQAADAKVTGDEINNLKSDLAQIVPGLSDEAKVALLACFAKVAWIDEHGQDYYDTLESALYPSEYPKIVAVFSSGQNTIYADDTLDSLKPYLTVKLYEDEQDTGTVIASANYSLSGTLTEGTSIITVTYEGLRTTVSISGVIDFYNIWEWSVGDGRMQKVVGSADPNQNDTTMYPSRALFRSDVTTRRNYNTYRGKAPFYLYNQTAQPSDYYPIPIPENANHVKITIEPPTQYVYVHMLPYNESTNSYGNSAAINRIVWNDGPGEVEKDITREIDGVTYNKMFLMMNSKYDSAGTSYPTEPTLVKITFSEVE